jgi:hypothetical protein
MDTTIEYVDMCQKAVEIQNLRHETIYEHNPIWLPKQDQLQLIYSNWIVEQLGYGNPEHFIKSAFIDFSRWLQNQYLPENFTCVPTNCFDTGEKLWLAFVMQEQFSKKWIDGDWR